MITDEMKNAGECCEHYTDTNTNQLNYTAYKSNLSSIETDLEDSVARRVRELRAVCFAGAEASGCTREDYADILYLMTDRLKETYENIYSIIDQLAEIRRGIA